MRRLLATESERVVICEPIAMEIRAGALDEYCHAKRERLVDGLRSGATRSAGRGANRRLEAFLAGGELGGAFGGVTKVVPAGSTGGQIAEGHHRS